ncbi:MAG: MmgE/PrpD family protein [Rhodospirillales bacterium]|nr:MmgE/PrpD family protein [Rhodospirillales bacterium]
MATVASRFAEWIAETATVPLAPEVVHATKRCLIDWFACVIPGGMTPAAAALVRSVGEDGGGRSMLFPSGRRVGPRAAALVNGTASHVLEFDDIYREAIYHPGVVVMPAALALAQARRIKGSRFLAAIVAGYEVSNRIGETVTPRHYEFWHTTGTVGAFGAAAASASALGLAAEPAAHALATAGTLAAGLQQAFRSDAMSKPLHAGRAAETGVLVGLAAEAGLTGALDIFEGKRGFGAAMAGDPDWSKAFTGLGTDYTIARMTQKNHSACGHCHAAVDGVIALVARHGLAADQVKKIRIGTYAKALEVMANRDPKTAFEAKFSLVYCVAAALRVGSVRLAAFTDERLADPDLRRAMGLVELAVDPEADRKFPGLRTAVVEIEMANGRRVSESVPTRKGDPDSPLSDDELAQKYRELVEPTLGATAAGKFLDALWAIDTLNDVAELPFAVPGLTAISPRAGRASPRRRRPFL